MYKNKKFIFSFFIILLGFFLRFYHLGQVPAGFHRDEAFLGYNAYSLLKTGRDMSGKFLPLHFESFIYSPGGYSYFAIPSIALFGLNEFAVRFPSALFGSLTIILIFLLVNKLLHNKTFAISILSAGFLAITPWHINLSRTSTESVLVVFFITLGMYLFLLWQESNKIKFLFFAFLSFSLTLTLYQAPRAFLPLFIPILGIATTTSRYLKKSLLICSVFIIFIIIPVLLILSSPVLATRMRTVGIWSTQETKLVIDEQIREDGTRHIPPILSRLVHNKLIGYSSTFIENYFKHLSYDFLFSDKGFPDRYRVSGSGLLYLSMLPFIVAGFIFLFQHHQRQAIILTSWIAIAIVGSALTFDDIPNLQRTLLVFPALSIITGSGVYAVYASKRKLLAVFIIGILSFGILFEGYRYIHHYYVQQIVHRPWYRHEGYKELVNEFMDRSNQYKHFVITNRESAPAIFFLFYTKYDPQIFQNETRNSTFRDFDRINFANYTFSIDECPLKEVQYVDHLSQETKTDCYAETDTLYANSGLCDVPKICANVLEIVKRNDGTPVFQILERSDAAATLSGNLKKN